MDIVFEIFSLLDPMDLLNLARTTKEFRGARHCLLDPAFF
jgi:hypothetical protein